MVAEAEQFSKGPDRRYMNPKHLRIVELLYSFMVVLSFYLLFVSRSEEVHTVWEVMHPAFIPVFFATTALLLVIIFSSERVEHKLILIILHSILSHVFFVVIFPAGYFGAQQGVLGKTRLVYDSVIFGGVPLGPENILVQMYNWVRGINSQAALSVVLARMLGIDFFWGHLFFVPLMWGAFVPVAAFLVTRAFCENKNVSVLSSLLVSLFPTSIIWGTYSVPNSLGFIFFFCSLYFILRYLFTTGPKTSFLMIIFSFATVVSHPLTGIISISLVLLAIILKNYENEKAKDPLSAKISLLLSFLVSTGLLPLSLVLFRFISPIFTTNFSLGKLYELSPTQIVGELILGQSVNFSLGGALICGLAPLVGFIGMIYVLRLGVNAGPNKTRRVCALFLFMGFLMVLVDYRILRLFMVDLPFREVDRLWVFRDFMAVPFVAFVVGGIVTSLQKATSKLGRIHVQFPFSRLSSASRAIITFAIIILLSGWITASVHFAYPHQGPLQTTSYELEAVKYIETNTNESYVVISDQWMMYVGVMIVGVRNPRANFSASDPVGATLFNKMKMNVSTDTMVEAMEYNNATIAYFIIEEPRLGAEEYNRIIQQAQLNGLQTYKTFHYRGEEKLRIFHHKESPE